MGNSQYFFLSRTTAASTQGKSISKSLHGYLQGLFQIPPSGPFYYTSPDARGLITLRVSAPGAGHSEHSLNTAPETARHGGLDHWYQWSPPPWYHFRLSRLHPHLQHPLRHSPHFHACLYNLSFQRLLRNVFVFLKIMVLKRMKTAYLQGCICIVN